MNFKKLVFILLLICLIIPAYLFSDNKEKIGKLGDNEWNKLIENYKKKNMHTDLVDSKVIVSNLKKYNGKLMQFPKIDFNDFVTDKLNQKYYYYGQKGTLDFYVIKYNEEINSKLMEIGYVFGGLSGNYEVLGTVEDAFKWWGNVVLMEIKAFREPGRVCILIEDGKAKIVGEELIKDELKNRETKSNSDIPKNLKSIPNGLDSLTVAKLFFHLSSVEKNKEVWEKVISKKMSGNIVNNHWKYLTTKDRTYFFVKADDVRTTDELKSYYFQIKYNGENLGTPKPIILQKEDGEWRVTSASP